MRDPEGARRASKTKEELTAKMRDSLRIDGKGGIVGVLTAIAGCGGSFELHEIPWGMFGSDTEPPGADALSAASALDEKRDHRGAIRMLQGVISEYPNHSVALNNLAACYGALGQHVEALAPITRAVEVEPNYSQYRGTQVAIAVNCPSRRHAAELFTELHRRFPHVHDHDYYGIHAYLRIGEPDRSQELLLKTTLPKEHADTLSVTVRRAIQARARYNSFRQELLANEHRDLPHEKTLRILEELHAACAQDPDVQASLGFRLRAAGQYERAHSLLLRAAGGIANQFVPYCWANAAYSLLRLGEWKHAAALLEATMAAVRKEGKDPHPNDIPGVVDWITEQGVVIETLKPSAAEVIDHALQECSDRSLATPAIEQMAALLRKFAATVDAPVRMVLPVAGGEPLRP